MDRNTPDHPDTRYVVSPSVVIREEGDNTLIVHLGTKRIHRISALGHEIYKQCVAGKSLGEICTFVSLKQGLDEEKVMPRLSQYLQEFSRRKVFRAVEEGE